MRFMIMHRTNAHWESGAIPSPTLMARVGALIGELAQSGALVAAEGLRASSEGARLRVAGGTRTVVNGPFDGGNTLPAGFSIVRASGNATFDAKVQSTMQGTVGEELPPPPPLYPDILNSSVSLTFAGRCP